MAGKDKLLTNLEGQIAEDRRTVDGEEEEAKRQEEKKRKPEENIAMENSEDINDYQRRICPRTGGSPMIVGNIPLTDTPGDLPNVDMNVDLGPMPASASAGVAPQNDAMSDLTMGSTVALILNIHRQPCQRPPISSIDSNQKNNDGNGEAAGPHVTGATHQETGEIFDKLKPGLNDISVI